MPGHFLYALPMESVGETDGKNTRVVPEGTPCKQCGYALEGLPSDGMCPECGLPIERSLTDDQLRHSSPAYLALLHRGVFLILAGIIAQLLLFVGALFIGFALSIGGVAIGTVQAVMTLFSLIATGAIAWGWFLFSAPDPAFVGRLDGSRARVVVRVAVVANAAVTLVTTVAQFALPVTAVAPGAAAPAVTTASVVLFLLSLVGFVAWAVSFFAAMLYLRWLCPRIPNWRAYRRAKIMMWLGPLLFTVGALCIGLGPLVAVVLYWNMLEWVRRDLKRIRVEQAGMGLV